MRSETGGVGGRGGPRDVGGGATTVRLVQADARDERGRADVEALWGEYLRWANDRFDTEYGFRLDVEDVLTRNMADLSTFQPPDGRLLLAIQEGGDTLGIGCLQRLRPDTGEIKRMYVRPTARGRGVGKAILGELLRSARTIGYRQILLDSSRFMHAAHALYRSVGFAEIEPYAESEIPPELHQHWVFMKTEL